ncbi:GTP pyrophosphokinase [Candidatus Stoquefichus sp. SB1]|jgi:putative GTP pyrophosphokinase|uniref:GTP pyrophosphokinase n=1 Tax=Candidatus Stoquefichus sp. SB1 TaxID=1658109 RepID=UPI00067F3870|nr:GTP pyrophosphokinase [Candidatus Stoquefichus sp. SB1]
MEFEEMLKDLKMNWEFMQPYRSAIQIVKTKLESIDDELKCENGDSPIHNIQSRIKTPDSILEKMARKGYSIDKKGFYQLNDIAGLRVVCHYINDIQYVSQLLIMHEDIQLVKKENYIDYPKESGYRSLHLVVRVQIYLKNGKVSIPVEIQLRTIAMDCWASLEHELYYKNHHCENEEVSSQLKECAIEIAKIDEKMQKIYQQLHNKI